MAGRKGSGWRSSEWLASYMVVVTRELGSYMVVVTRKLTSYMEVVEVVNKVTPPHLSSVGIPL